MIKTTDPKQTIGTVHTSVGPAQLVHCYKHPRNVAIALSTAPLLSPSMIELWDDKEWVALKGKYYMTTMTDQARLLRMVSSMGICSECVQDAMLADLNWTRFIFIVQIVRNWHTNKELTFGAFGGKQEVFDRYEGIHTMGTAIDLSFVGQIKSTVEYFCPTCFHAFFYRTPSVEKIADVLDIPHNSLRADLRAQTIRNIRPPISEIVG